MACPITEAAEFAGQMPQVSGGNQGYAYNFYNYDLLCIMNKSLTHLDRLVILCRDVARTSAIYSETLGLKISLQSQSLVQLRDNNNFKLYLKQANKPYQLHKGYSPILSFKVQHFDQIHKKMLQCPDIMQDGEIIETHRGKIVSYLGIENEHITINNLIDEQELQTEALNDTQEEPGQKQIRNILSKLKL